MRLVVLWSWVVGIGSACQYCSVNGPAKPSEQPQWLEQLKADRDATLKRINWTGGVFNVTQLKWTQTAYIQPQMHPYDRFFYDPVLGNYTVQKYLEDLKTRYGGIDAVLVWPTYTNIGIDDRDQFDFFRALPGGLDGVAQFTRELKRSGVHVLWPYNPWDKGTRKEPGFAMPSGYQAYPGANACDGHGAVEIDRDPILDLTEAECMARCDADSSCECVTYGTSYNDGSCWKRKDCQAGQFLNATEYTVFVKAASSKDSSYPGRNDADTWVALLKQTGGDGFNGDTMDSIPKIFWDSAARTGYPLAFQPEGGGSDEALNWDTMGWGYWNYPMIPPVDRFKFLTYGKFLTNICNRWAKNKTDDVQFAWFNGMGYESWENVWGTWNGIVPRDGEAIRRVASMLRHFGFEGFLQSELWEPHSPDVLQDGVYASKWPLPDKGAVLWSIVNRRGVNLTGAQLKVTRREKAWFYDCYHGDELDDASSGQLSFFMEAGGYGCVLQTSSPASGQLSRFLQSMKDLTSRSLASFSGEWTCLKQSMVPIAKTARASSAPAGMVRIPGTLEFDFSVRGVEIEGDDSHCVDVQFPWEQQPGRKHTRTMPVGPFYMDKHPVTCANYSQYLLETGFNPKDPYNWLKNWNGSQPHAPLLLQDLPVTYVSLNEARNYCKWAGARLPHSWEWQYAAQSTDHRVYPWGNILDQTRFPVENRGRSNPGPEPVGSYSPAGDSPFGVSDLVGNVWQYTDEFQDAHTRAVLLRGGSNYRPIDPSSGAAQGWYFPEAHRLDEHNKYFLMDDSYERAGTIGFRCMVDAAESDDSLVIVG